MSICFGGIFLLSCKGGFGHAARHLSLGVGWWSDEVGAGGLAIMCDDCLLVLESTARCLAGITYCKGYSRASRGYRTIQQVAI